MECYGALWAFVVVDVCINCIMMGQQCMISCCASLRHVPPNQTLQNRYSRFRIATTANCPSLLPTVASKHASPPPPSNASTDAAFIQRFHSPTPAPACFSHGYKHGLPGPSSVTSWSGRSTFFHDLAFDAFSVSPPPRSPTHPRNLNSG